MPKVQLPQAICDSCRDRGMFNFAALENSKKLYLNARDYFAKSELTSGVIEVSDRPFGEWKVHPVESDLEMVMLRMQLRSEKKSFVSLNTSEYNTYFYYADRVFTKSENLTTGEVVVFEFCAHFTTDFDRIRNEFSDLKKSLQGA